MLSASLSSKPTDFVRINELTLLLPLANGGQCQPAQDEVSAVLQPISISLSIKHDIKEAASSDDLSRSIDYARLTDQLQESLSSKPSYPSLEGVAKAVCEFIVREYSDSFKGFELKVAQTKPLLQCKRTSVIYSSSLVHGQWKIDASERAIEELVCPTMIGVVPCERLQRQDVVITLKIRNGEKSGDPIFTDMRTLIEQIFENVYNSDYLTLEALASSIAKETLSIVSTPGVPVVVTVHAAKPRALALAKNAEIVITRTPEDYAHVPSITSPVVPGPTVAHLGHTHTAVLAFGSNLGDRFRNIELSLRLLEIPEEILKPKQNNDFSGFQEMKLHVVDTSFLYATAPMYVIDQPSFINGACVIQTNISPLTLLRLVKEIESIVGRVPSIRNGPRAVDLDIMFYDNDIFDTRPVSKRQDFENLRGQLVIPHPRIAEREFVLRPLHDIIPNFVHPNLKRTVNELLQDLKMPPNEPPMEKVIPFPSMPLAPNIESPYSSSIPPVPHTLTHWKHNTSVSMKFKTKLMATLNTTPDSFSDGSTHNTMQTALAYVKESVEVGSSIIDIGGYSTRPGAPFVTVDEEVERVSPFIRAIRSFHTPERLEDERTASQVPAIYQHVLVSVDTFRWEVAEAAVRAGANCINDVYAFSGPNSYLSEDEDEIRKSEETLENMKRIATRYAVPVVLMHSRGDAGQNKDYSGYEYAGPGQSVLEGVRVELGDRIDRIVKGKGGVRRWLIIADPGIGFSKTVEGNLEVLRSASQVTADILIGPEDNRRQNPLTGFPQLIGVSRKSFLGAILAEGQNGRSTHPKDRIWATAAAVACAVQQGALVVRVHDVGEMHDVVRVSDTLWR